MRSLRPTVLLVGGLCLLLPAAAAAQKLDGDDKRFLKDVGPIILPEERAVFDRLEDKADRLVFQDVFWARRDPDLATPENEFQQQYERDRATADREYRIPGVAAGSETGCGLLFILFGEPDAMEPNPAPVPLGAIHTRSRHWSGGHTPPRALSFRVHATGRLWVYKDQPGRRLDVDRLEIPFDSLCRSGHRFFPVLLERMATLKIVHPNIDYDVGQDGHLVKPADQLAGDTPSPPGSSGRP